MCNTQSANQDNKAAYKHSMTVSSICSGIKVVLSSRYRYFRDQNNFTCTIKVNLLYDNVV